ncbi:hypothetical protein PUNSTDRAFT_60165 [Punctularia strigosozonata HHB-11173 SS5]|uniref:uncharacterized protein n=1 Tax=Punctularia strigosozonata (strain HHB-11173) TaxID=741275 RepID=UPI0004416A83|nr:uncharacterized protein PUNSTDRAFT_60165 [Punctularia strigosozonata HHB-11173 SS5]EIN12564.1 hypothetical protein PUNSTDRAFT_60165 [Punctularia strigosozonata HHB-11173 SS5]
MTGEAPKVIRDNTYYFPDGSCVLRVENTLFNVRGIILIVHRSILSKDGSSFAVMFSLPQGDTSREGTSDDNPVILPSDTVTEFRNFIWALYALPHELMAVHTDHWTDLAHLIDIAKVSNKYSFKSLETWALDAIQAYLNRKPSPFSRAFAAASAAGAPPSAATLGASGQELTRLVRLAQLCSHEKLLNTVVGLLRQLMALSPQYAYLAMTLADELDLRPLRGLAYLEVMHRVPFVAVKPGSASGLVEGDLDADGKLVVSPAQQLRLLHGYHCLTSQWEKLRGRPPSFEHATSCGATWHQHGCTQSWLEFWKEKTRSDGILALGLADVLGRLRTIAKDFDRWGSATYMHQDCRLSAKRSINDRIKDIENNLSNYFNPDSVS